MIKKIVSIVFVIFVIVIAVVPTYAMSIGDTNSKFNSLAYPPFVVDMKHNGYVITDSTVTNGNFPISQIIDDYYTLSFDGYNISVQRSVQYDFTMADSGFEYLRTTYTIDNSPFDTSFDGSLRMITNGIYLYDSYETVLYTRSMNPYIYIQTSSNVRAYVTLKGVGYDGSVVTGSRIEIFGVRDGVFLRFYLGDVFRGISNDYKSLYCSMFAIEFESSASSTFDSIAIGSPLTTTDFKLQIFEDMANEAENIGYSAGYSQGIADADGEFNVFEGFMKGFGSIFEVKVFGSIGLGDILYVFIGVAIVGIVIRFFAGG